MAVEGLVPRAGGQAPVLSTALTASRPAFQLLQSKLRVPHSRTGTVAREALITAMEGPDAAPVVLLSAGPGWGKTTLLSQWASASKRPFAWVSVDEHDN